jgi:prolyl oligopeptidase
MATPSGLTYPSVARGPTTDVMHGVPVADPYRHLEEDSPSTAAFVAAQQQVFADYTAAPAFAALRPKLRAQMERQYNYERVGLPSLRGAHAFFFRNTGLQNQDVLYKAAAGAQPGAFGELAAAAQPLLDLNAEFPAGTTSLNTHSFTKSGSLMAYALAHGGSDWVTVKVRDVASGKDLPDSIPWVKFSGLAWLGEAGFFYSRYPSPVGVSLESSAGSSSSSGGGTPAPAPAAAAPAKDAGTETAANHSAAVYYHALGTPTEADLLVYACPEQPQWRAGIHATDDEAYLLLHISKGTDPVNRLYVARAGTFGAWAAGRAGRPLAPGEAPPRQADYPYLPFRRLFDNFEAEWDCVASLGSRLFLKTNLGAPKGRIVVHDLPPSAGAGSEAWEDAGHTLAPYALGQLSDIDAPAAPTPGGSALAELLPQHDSEVLDWAAHCAGDRLVTCVLKDVVNVLRVYQLPGPGTPPGAFPAPPQLLALPGPGTVAAFSGRPELPKIYVKYVSFTTPGTSLVLDLSSSSSSSSSAAPAPAPAPALTFLPFWSATIPGFDASKFTVKQDFVTAKDGARVPIFLVHAADLPLPAPTLLYAYGGFSINMQPSFSPLRLAWLQNLGGVYVLACIRGGGEYGEEAWHAAGARLNKRTCFNDFAAVAGALAERGVTTPRQLAIMGGSNGGLLTLAASLRAPALYGAAVSQVPVADFLRFGLFTIGHAWRGEYGYVEDREDFFNLLALSPYHTALAAGAGGAGSAGAEAPPLPAILVVTADHDDRVVPLHSFKMVAALQHAYGSRPAQKAPLLLRVESKAGHGAGKPTSKILDEYSEVRLMCVVCVCACVCACGGG